MATHVYVNQHAMLSVFQLFIYRRFTIKKQARSQIIAKLN